MSYHLLVNRFSGSLQAFSSRWRSLRLSAAVERLDFTCVFLSDDAALQLHAGGQFPALNGPFVRNDAEAFDLLPWRCVGVDAVELLLVAGNHLRILE